MGMTKQLTRKNGLIVSRGIEWTDYTNNIIAGCQHDCRWKMPDRKIAICYADLTVQSMSKRSPTFRSAYPEGFQHHYYHEKRMGDIESLRSPSRIFVDSMSDLMGQWVPKEQVSAVLATFAKSPRHSIQMLTKNAPRLLWFDKEDGFPENMWVGVSSPPDFMHGKPLAIPQQNAMLRRSLSILGRLESDVVRWMSFEPLSRDVSEIVENSPVLDWAVIGAASNGRQVHQPNPEHVGRLLEVLDAQNVPVFFKGNLWGNEAVQDEWREYFPGFAKSAFMGVELGPGAIPVG